MFVKKIKAYDLFENDLRLVSAIEGAPPMNYGTPYIYALIRRAKNVSQKDIGFRRWLKPLAKLVLPVVGNH